MYKYNKLNKTIKINVIMLYDYSSQLSNQDDGEFEIADDNEEEEASDFDMADDSDDNNSSNGDSADEDEQGYTRD